MTRNRGSWISEGEAEEAAPTTPATTLTKAGSLDADLMTAMARLQTIDRYNSKELEEAAKVLEDKLGLTVTPRKEPESTSSTKASPNESNASSPSSLPSPSASTETRSPAPPAASKEEDLSEQQQKAKETKQPEPEHKSEEKKSKEQEQKTKIQGVKEEEQESREAPADAIAPNSKDEKKEKKKDERAKEAHARYMRFFRSARNNCADHIFNFIYKCVSMMVVGFRIF